MGLPPAPGGPQATLKPSPNMVWGMYMEDWKKPWVWATGPKSFRVRVMVSMEVAGAALTDM